MLNKKEEALSYVNQIESFHQLQPELVKNLDLSFAWWGIGDRQKSFSYMFKAIEKKDQMLSFMINSPLYMGLHDDPRFEDVKKKMNL
jgi:hypothetical protein